MTGSMFEWVRFWICALLMTGALISFTAAVIGCWRFGFVMNRMHAGGIGDTQGLFLVVAALCVSSANGVMNDLKLVLLVVFMWFSSPVSSHFLSQIEYYTNPSLYSHVRRAESKDEPD